MYFVAAFFVDSSIYFNYAKESQCIKGDGLIVDNINQGIRVKIYGQSYQIKGDVPSSHIIDVANWVDTKMQEIGSRNPYLDHTKVAVLAAINIADELFKVRKEIEEVYRMIAEDEQKEQTE